MTEIFENFTVTLYFQTKVNTDTGEITTECVKKSIDKIEGEPKKKRTSKVVVKSDNISDPLLTLEENKYQLSQKAVELMSIQPDDKLDIKYEKIGKQIVPVIATDENFNSHTGNRVTKSFTVSYRGSKREELSKYGSVFTIVKHPDKEGRFILQNEDNKIEEALKNEEQIEFPMDDDLQMIIDDKDANITEIDPSLFNL